MTVTVKDYHHHLFYLNDGKGERGLTIDVGKVSAQLLKMQEDGVVDKSVTREIDVVLSEIESSGVETALPGRSLRDAFYPYLALDTARDVLEALKVRIEESERGKDNPIVVDDSLKLMPLLNEVICAAAGAPRTLNEEYKRRISSRVNQLRSGAAALHLLPSFEKTIEKVDKKAVTKTMVSVSERYVDE